MFLAENLIKGSDKFYKYKKARREHEKKAFI
jgi:hypothetical protein